MFSICFTNKNKADKILAPIGVQPALREVIINLAKDRLSQVESDVKKEKRVVSDV